MPLLRVSPLFSARCSLPSAGRCSRLSRIREWVVRIRLAARRM